MRAEHGRGPGTFHQSDRIRAVPATAVRSAQRRFGRVGPSDLGRPRARRCRPEAGLERLCGGDPPPRLRAVPVREDAEGHASNVSWWYLFCEEPLPSGRSVLLWTVDGSKKNWYFARRLTLKECETLTR